MRKYILTTLALVVMVFVANAQTWEIVGPTAVCPGAQNVTYTIQSTGGGLPFGTTYWTLDGQSVGTGLSVQIDFPSTGQSFTVRAANLFVGINETLVVSSIGANPGTVVVTGGVSGTCNGGSVSIDVSGHSGNLKWQRRVGSGLWSDYGLGFTEPLNESGLTVGTQYQYRVRTNTTCATQYSNTVTFTPKNPVNAGTASGNQTICSGETPSSITSSAASGGGGNYTYSWEKKPVSGGSWTNIGGGSSLSPSEIGSLTQATKFRRKVTDLSCGTDYSNEVTVSIASNLNAGTIGNAQTICYNGDPSTLTNVSSASGGTGTINYQWQYSNNGTNGWVNVSGATSSTFNPPNLTSTRWYRRRVTRCNQMEDSNVIEITVHPTVVPGSIGNAQTLCYNENPAALTNTGSASGGTGTIIYQWQYSNNGTSGWTNLSGETGTTYDPPALTASRWYRRRALSCGQTLYTNVVKITIHDDLLPGSILGTQSICYNTAPSELTSFSAASGGGSGLSYQWQESADGTNYSNISATGSSYQPGILTADRWYRRGAYTNDCSIEYTSSVKVTVDALTNGGTLMETTVNNDSIEVFGTTDVNLSLSGEVGNIIQWQYKTTGGWQNIANTTDTHSEVNVTEPTYYRAEVKNGTCVTGYSNEVFVNVFPNPQFDFGIRTSVRPGSGTTVSVDDGYANYQWFKDDVSVQNGNSHELQVTHPGKYRVTITTNLGATFATGNATISNQLEEDRTYVMVYDFRKSGYSDTSDLFGIPMADMSITADVYDGLGRPIQKINMEGSPDGDDLVAPMEYDDFGREQKSYLPYVSGDFGQLYKPDALGTSSKQKTFYDSAFSQNDKAFSENKFEKSPLNRVVEQGLPGKSWGIGSQHSIKMSYQVNQSTDTVKMWSMNGDLPQDDGDYADGKLFKNIVTNENGDSTITFTNFGQDPILIRKQVDSTKWTETYYIYDIRNRLRVVLQPEGVKNLAQYTGTTQAKENFLAAWAFQYGYDAENRQIWKQVPGAGRMRTVYDAWDRIRMTRDSVQGDNDEWAFIKYDVLNRPIMTGIRSDSSNHASATSSVAGDPDLFETYNSTTHTYSDNMYPSVATGVELQTVTFYDNYDFLQHAEWDSANLAFNEALPQRITLANPLGTVTGTKTKVSDGSWIYSTSHYDDKGRVIQTRSTNHLGGVDVVTNHYNFANEVTKTITEHGNGTATTTITREFEYDHRGRLQRTWHQVNNAPRILIAENEYNELDEVEKKRLHSIDGIDFEQYVDYTYNIRRWLTAINDSGLTNTSEGDLFGMELAYDEALSGLSGSTNQYNGNISAMRWSNHDVSGSGPSTRAYMYDYDKLSRLTGASHYENNGSSSVDQFSVSDIGYDRNGNILSLTRKDDTGANMDELNYNYGTGANQSNQLQYVNDLSDVAAGFDDNYTNTSQDYTYDSNGNMISDGNKEIDKIYYNHLNLPLIVDFDAPGDSIRYLYDAAGIKLQQQVYRGDTLRKTIDYVGEFIYETLPGEASPSISQIQHEDGRLVPYYLSDSVTLGGFDYEYHLKDHLGNVRVAFEALDYWTIETFESEHASEFYNVTKTNNPTANTTVGGNEVQQLDEGNVGAMVMLEWKQGDEVNLRVDAYHEDAQSINTFATIAYSTLFNLYDNSPYGTGEGSSTIESEFNDALSGMSGGKGNNTSVPKAFLNYIVFDTAMNYLSAGFTQVTAAAYTHETLELNGISASEDGYILIYVSNENNDEATVFFDEFIVHMQSPINVIQSDDYYPYGLTFNSYQAPSARENRFRYNGKEYDENTQWYDYEARMYQADIGRWFAVDPLADMMRSNSPYNYAFNNPIRFIDPDGRLPRGGYGQILDNNNTGAVTHYDYSDSQWRAQSDDPNRKGGLLGEIFGWNKKDETRANNAAAASYADGMGDPAMDEKLAGETGVENSNQGINSQELPSSEQMADDYSLVIEEYVHSIASETYGMNNSDIVEYVYETLLNKDYGEIISPNDVNYKLIIRRLRVAEVEMRYVEATDRYEPYPIGINKFFSNPEVPLGYQNELLHTHVINGYDVKGDIWISLLLYPVLND